MAGRHAAAVSGAETSAPACDSDRCHICGRKYPAAMKLDELAASAESYRRMQRAAAGLRITTDRRLSEPTRAWVHDLAAEKPNSPLPDGWAEVEVSRLEEEARAECPCRCHGPMTPREVEKADRASKQNAAARKRIHAALDRRFGDFNRVGK